jgi:hypothetical protein
MTSAMLTAISTVVISVFLNSVENNGYKPAFPRSVRAPYGRDPNSLLYHDFEKPAMSSKTKYTTFKKLSDKDELGVVLGRLMMAVNDIGVCNDGLGAWMGEQKDAIRKERQQGARMYFVRMLISHTCCL